MKKINTAIQLIALYGFQILLFFAFTQKVSELECHNCSSRNLPLFLPSIYKNPYRFSEKFVLNGLKRKKIIHINYTGIPWEDEKRFQIIKIEARRLKYTYDTAHVIEVHFTKENTYGDFVRLVSLMHEDLHKRYVFLRDTFIIYGEEYEPIIKTYVISNPIDL